MADTHEQLTAAAEGVSAATPAASSSAPKKTARLANFPPVPPPIPRGPQVPDPSRPGATDDDDDNDNDEDDVDAAREDGESSGAESVFDEPINTGGNTLADRVQAKLDEREFQDEQKRQERIVEIDAGGDQEAEALKLQEEQQKQQQDDLAELLAEYEDDTEDLELTHARLKSLEPLNLPRFAKTLKRLSFRQNLLTTLTLDDGSAPLEALTEVEEIDLYDNRISKVSGLKGLTKLTSLDLSFNLIRKVPTSQISTMKALKVLYFIQNKISKIEGLESISGTLESIEFGGNKLRKIENLDSCLRLTELWLGKNKITELAGMSTLRNLKILSIQSNRITKLEGLEELESLEELYISHNGIKRLEGLEKNTKLRVLDIGNNFIQDLENVAHLASMEEFWANNNMISDFSQVEKQLAGMQSLETVYFEGNPIQKDLGSSYRRKIVLALPQVGQIDATFVQQR